MVTMKHSSNCLLFCILVVCELAMYIGVPDGTAWSLEAGLAATHTQPLAAFVAFIRHLKTCFQETTMLYVTLKV